MHATSLSILEEISPKENIMGRPYTICFSLHFSQAVSAFQIQVIMFITQSRRGTMVRWNGSGKGRVPCFWDLSCLQQ